MKNLLIIGARGFGRDIYKLAKECIGYQKDYRIKGFLDNNKNALDLYDGYPSIFGSYEDYEIEENDVFICAFGDVKSKKECVNRIISKGGKFISLIHPNANVDNTAKIGTGSIVLQYATLGAGSIVGNFVLIQISTIIGHDASVGDYSRIDCNAVCIGGIIVKEEATIHTSAIINHKVVIGKGACVGAGSFVIRSVKEYTTVYGNPAIRLK